LEATIDDRAQRVLFALYDIRTFQKRYFLFDLRKIQRTAANASSPSCLGTTVTVWAGNEPAFSSIAGFSSRRRSLELCHRRAHDARDGVNLRHRGREA
jgi:hypothetical protein